MKTVVKNYGYSEQFNTAVLRRCAGVFLRGFCGWAGATEATLLGVNFAAGGADAHWAKHRISGHMGIQAAEPSRESRGCPQRMA